LPFRLLSRKRIFSLLCWRPGADSTKFTRVPFF
jgi:hypothetical protein